LITTNFAGLSLFVTVQVFDWPTAIVPEHSAESVSV
jgi:hypothetical protein